MDYSMGQTGKVPGPIAMSFPGIDQQTGVAQTDRQKDRETKPNG